MPQLFLFSFLPIFPSVEVSSTKTKTLGQHTMLHHPISKDAYTKKKSSKIPLVHKSQIASTIELVEATKYIPLILIKHNSFHVLASATLQITAKLRHKYKHPIK